MAFAGWRSLLYERLGSQSRSMTTPPFPTATALPVGQPPRTWFERNWKWFVPLLVFAGLLVLSAFVGVIYVSVTTMFRSSYPYDLAVKRAADSPAVSERIGTPFRVGWVISGSLNYRNADGDVDMSIPISGNRGKGRILVSGKKRDGQWTFDTFEVDVEGGEPIPLQQPEPPASPNTPVNST